MVGQRRKKNNTPVLEVTTPLSTLTNKKQRRKIAVETKTHKKSPIAEDSGEQKQLDIQSPIFNIHVHMPTTPNDLKESSQVQPIIHLHFGDIVSTLTSGSASQNVDVINNSLKVETMAALNYNLKMQGNKEIIVKSSGKSLACRMLNFKSSVENCEDLGTEKADAALTVNDNAEKNLEPPENSESSKNKTPVKNNVQVIKNFKSSKNQKDLADEIVKRHTRSARNSQLPVRRSIRVANNVKLSQAIKALSVNKCKTDKVEDRKCLSKNIKNKSDQFINPFGVHEPLIILCEKCREIENDKKEKIPCKEKVGNEEDCSSATIASTQEVNNENNSCEMNKASNDNEDMEMDKTSCDNEHTEINKTSYDKEGTEMNDKKFCCGDSALENNNDRQELKNTSCDEANTDIEGKEIQNDECVTENVRNSSTDDSFTDSDDNEKVDDRENKSETKKPSSAESLLSLTKKSGEIYSSVFTSNNETSCEESNLTDFEEQCNFLSNFRINPLHTVHTNGSCTEDTENIQPKRLALEVGRKIQGERATPTLVLHSTEHLNGNVSGAVTTQAVVNGNSDSNHATATLEVDLDDSGPDTAHKTDTEEDHQTPPQMESDLENEKNSLINMEELEVLSTKSDSCEEMNVTSPSFHLELISKELQKRNMAPKNRKNPKHAIKKKKLSQINKGIHAKKMKVSDKMVKSTPLHKMVKSTPSDQIVKSTPSDKTRPTEKNSKRFSSDYISLNAQGPTKFAVAQINYLKPSEHKAKNFRNELLFGKRIARFQDSNHFRAYRKKKEVAGNKNKFKSE